MELTAEEKLKKVKAFALEELQELEYITGYNDYKYGAMRAYARIIDIIDELNDEREW